MDLNEEIIDTFFSEVTNSDLLLTAYINAVEEIFDPFSIGLINSTLSYRLA